MIQPQRGEIWWVNLNPTKGREQSGKRPGLVISDNIFNAGPAELIVVLPLTTRYKAIPLHEKIVPPEGGLSETSYIKCEDIRSISKQRLIAKIGNVSERTLQAVQEKIQILLSF
ncbi:MAG: type II toxin-antitoxin system PemK/MazF family toxin [Desulfohalobium sp.]